MTAAEKVIVCGVLLSIVLLLWNGRANSPQRRRRAQAFEDECRRLAAERRLNDPDYREEWKP